MSQAENEANTNGNGSKPRKTQSIEPGDAPDKSAASKARPRKAVGRKPATGKARGEDGGESVDTEAKNSAAGPIANDATYSELQLENRVVMRHTIALNLESFRASTDAFNPRPQGDFAPLAPVTPPFFSVVIPNYNGMAHLPTLMAALAAQSFQDFEIIVVDDAGTDPSVSWLEEHYPHVRIIMNRRNLGFAVSCNLGATAARGRFVVLLNTDTEPDADWLAETAQAICRHPEATVFASKLLFFDRRDVIHTAGDYMAFNGVPGHRGFGQRDEGQFDREVEVFGGCGGAVAVRRDVWELLGGFDESLWMYMEDVDLAFRGQLLGIKAIFVPAARVYHHMGATGGGALASYFVGRNTIWVLAKNLPASLWLRYWPQILAEQAREAVAALRAWRGEAARARLRGMLSAVVGLPGVLSKRWAVQSKRVATDEEVHRTFGQK